MSADSTIMSLAQRTNELSKQVLDFLKNDITNKALKEELLDKVHDISEELDGVDVSTTSDAAFDMYEGTVEMIDSLIDMLDQ